MVSVSVNISVNLLQSMPWQQTIGVLEMMVKGFVIGVAASAPMGPVGILCVQRSLNKGRWFGFATGVGAAVSDILYALFTGYGLSIVSDFLENPTYSLWIKMVGSVMMLAFGVYTFYSRPQPKNEKTVKTKSSFVNNVLSGFFVTLSNPLIILLFLALFGQMSFIVPDMVVPQIFGFFFILVGALFWWFVLTKLVDKLHKKFDERGVWKINRIIGVVVIVASVGALITTLLGLSFY